MTSKSKHVKFNCIEVKQPIGTFYIGSINFDDLIAISYADVRRIEERDVEKYLGIQRPLAPNRVKELNRYVNLVDATFPTGIIITVSNEDCEYDAKKSIMEIRKDEGVAKIIDGQHRIAGLKDFKGKTFQMNVTMFVDMDIEDQAMVFATINLKHTKVSKSLMYDLFDFAKARSPQKTCHNIAKLLNVKNGSPFKDRIKILGVAHDAGAETLTQATFVESLLKYITKNAMEDRDLLKRGKTIKKISSDDSKKLIFRNLFIENKEPEIAKNIWNYFEAVSDCWPNSWNKVTKGNILNRSTGFLTLMRFLKLVYNNSNNESGVVAKADYLKILKKIKIKDGSFTSDNYLPGSSGPGKLFSELCNQSGVGE